MTAPNKIKHNGQLYVLASPGPAQFGKCPWCKKKMEIGDELPEERICDACATLPQEKLEKLNPVLFRKLHKTASTPPKKQTRSIPNQIKFRGAMYVKIGGGGKSPSKPERCPAGKHWNSKTKKCEELSEDLAAHRLNAAKISNKALRNESYELHEQAGKAHRLAAKKLHGAGFHGLAKKHLVRDNYHHELASELWPAGAMKHILNKGKK